MALSSSGRDVASVINSLVFMGACADYLPKIIPDAVLFPTPFGAKPLANSIEPSTLNFRFSYNIMQQILLRENKIGRNKEHFWIVIYKRPLCWVGSAKKDLQNMPEDVADVFGYALYLAQNGHKHPQAKPLKGFGSAGVLEVVEAEDGSTYRAVYTVKFSNGVYVLHCFQKKSKKGIETSKQDKDLIEARLQSDRLHSEGAEHE